MVVDRSFVYLLCIRSKIQRDSPSNDDSLRGNIIGIVVVTVPVGNTRHVKNTWSVPRQPVCNNSVKEECNRDILSPIKGLKKRRFF